MPPSPALDALIFDLDGTLWDSCGSCALAWNKVLRRHGIAFRDITADDVRGVTGRPHAECIEIVFRGLPRHQIDLLVADTMVEDNLMIEQHGGELYPGVREGLAHLAASYPLHIVSNCQAGYIETFMGWSGLGGLFRDFECWGNTGLGKAENIRALMERNRVQSALYVGDTEGDRQAAAESALPFVQVTYGFGKPLPGVEQAHTFEELLNIVT